MRKSDKLPFIGMLGALSALAPLSNDASLPAFPQMSIALHAPPGVVQATLGSFLLAFGLGQLFYGPLSDRWGRRRTIVLGLSLYALASVACTFAPSAGILIAARVFQGLGACAGLVVVRAIVRDVVTDRSEAGSMQAYVTVAFSFTPVVAPLIGAAILPLGWRAIYGFLALIGVVLIGVALVALPETLATPSRSGVATAYAQFLRLPRTLVLIVIVACVFGAYFSFISGSPFVLQRQLGLSPLGFAIAFALNALALIAGSYTGGRLAARIGPERILRTGTIAVAIVGVATLLQGMHPTVAGFMLSMSAFAFAYAMTVPQAYAIGLHEAPSIAGTAAATLGSAQQLGGSLGSTVVGALPFVPSVDIGLCAIAGGAISAVAYALGAPRGEPNV